MAFYTPVVYVLCSIAVMLLSSCAKDDSTLIKSLHRHTNSIKSSLFDIAMPLESTIAETTCSCKQSSMIEKITVYIKRQTMTDTISCYMREM
jgi:hypothetical protein